MQKETSSLTDFFSGINDYYTKKYELAAIWLDKPLITATDRTVRICPGTEVTLQDGFLTHCTGKPTHVVKACYGTLSNILLEFELQDLKTKEITTLNPATNVLL
jgi:hypothetical protein